MEAEKPDKKRDPNKSSGKASAKSARSTKSKQIIQQIAKNEAIQEYNAGAPTTAKKSKTPKVLDNGKPQSVGSASLTKRKPTSGRTLNTEVSDDNNRVHKRKISSISTSQISQNISSVDAASRKKQKTKNGLDTSANKKILKESEIQRSNISQMSSTSKRPLILTDSSKPTSGKGKSISMASRTSHNEGNSDHEKSLAGATKISKEKANKSQPDHEEEIKYDHQGTIESLSDKDMLGKSLKMESARKAAEPELNIRDEAQDGGNRQNNMPASPASRAPILNIQTNPRAENAINIVNERQYVEDTSPMSCAPRFTSSKAPQEPDQQSFGIKLLELSHQETKSQDSPDQIQTSTKKSKAVVAISDSRKQNTPTTGKMSALGSQSSKRELTKAILRGYKTKLPEPLPLLPKVTTSFQMPPKCPLETIRFIQLKRFQMFQKQLADQMSAGFDLVGQRRKMIQMKTEDKIKKGVNFEELEKQAKIDETTHYIKNIIFARDPTIMETENGLVNQRAAFSHTNNLDIKQLIRKKELIDNEGNYPVLSPRNLAPRRLKLAVKDAQVYKLQDEQDKTLMFESRFESGNLYLAQKVSDVEYNLLMANDVNTQGHTQWFFFQVKNTRAKSRVRFNILNYSKPDSLFNYGMKVSVYSDKKSEKKDIGWHKDGEEIRYFQNQIRKDVTYYSKSYYTLTFTYNFEHDHDTVYFAYSVPYTYSDLRNDLTSIETDPDRQLLCTKKQLCKTLSGESCDVLTITSRDNLDNFPNRKGIVITARVHPGETVGSWMMRGVLTFLTDPNNHEAKLLRENFVFKVIPMLNPDGVINGNYRCSLAGCDLNRRWKTPSKVLHPTIYATKKLVKQIHQERGLVMFCDLHGHSRKQNVFMYGCNIKNNPGECRIFPFILSKINPYFCYDYSRFGVQKSKESTARVALFKELKNVPNIYTMESSFAGLDMGKAAGQHLTTDMLETLGHDACRSLLIYQNIYIPPELHDIPFFLNMLQQQKKQAEMKAKNPGKKFKEDEKPKSNFKDMVLGVLNDNKDLLKQDADSSSGSDSAPSEDNMQAEELVKQLPTVDKTLKLQLKKNQEKKKAEEAEKEKSQSPVKIRRQSSGATLKKNLNEKRNPSPVKRQITVPDRNNPKEDKVKEDKKKKPKPEMKDAETQTDRCDYPQIKARMLKEKALKAQKAQQEAAAKAAQADTENQSPMLKDGQQPLGAKQWMSLVQNNDSSNSRQTKVANQSEYHMTGYQSQQTSKATRQGNSDSMKSRNRTEFPSNTSDKVMIPDKKKYDFMGVSSMKSPNGDPRLLNLQKPQISDYTAQQNYKNRMPQIEGIDQQRHSRERDLPNQKSPNKLLTPGGTSSNNFIGSQLDQKQSRINPIYQTQKHPLTNTNFQNPQPSAAGSDKKSRHDQAVSKSRQNQELLMSAKNHKQLPSMHMIASPNMKQIQNPAIIIAQVQAPANRMPVTSNNFHSLQKQSDVKTPLHAPLNYGANLFGGPAGMPKNTFSLPHTKQVQQQQFIMDLSTKNARQPAEMKGQGGQNPLSGQRRLKGDSKNAISSVQKINNLLNQTNVSANLSASLNPKPQPNSMVQSSEATARANPGSKNKQMRQSFTNESSKNQITIPREGQTYHSSHQSVSSSKNQGSTLPALNVRSQKQSASKNGDTPFVAAFNQQNPITQQNLSDPMGGLKITSGTGQISSSNQKKQYSVSHTQRIVNVMNIGAPSNSRGPSNKNPSQLKNHQHVTHSNSCHKPQNSEIIQQALNRKNHKTEIYSANQQLGKQFEARTPSSSNLDRVGQKITIDMQKQLTTKTVINNPNALASLSLEGAPLDRGGHDERRVGHGSEQAKKNRNGDGMLPRFRNASEIGELRSNSKMQSNTTNQNQGLQQQLKPTVLTPQVDYKQKTAFLSASNSQSKTIGDRYSRH